MSLRARLLAILLSATIAVWLLTTITSYIDTRHEIGEMFDAQLAQAGRTLLTLSRHELHELNEHGIDDGHIHFIPENIGPLAGHHYEHSLAYQIWSTDSDKLMIHSNHAPETPLSDIRHGFSDRLVQGRPWRVFSLSDPDSEFMVQLGESYDLRDELSGHIVRRLGLPMLLALPLLALIIWLGVGRALAPLNRLTGEIGNRAATRLDPVSDLAVPAEIAPMVHALNHLFERLQLAFDNERRFTADAAHELRTPLAALRTQAEVALRARDDASREQALRQVLRGVERATHLVEQLLTLARLDPDSGLQHDNALDLCALARETLAELAGSAAAKQIELALNEPCAGNCPGHGASLAILLRNLVDNALRYTPAGGSVEVSLHRSGTEQLIEVADSGPGIPTEERERVFDRFYRRVGSGGDGSGLGLSIAQRIVELHGGRISLDQSPLGGLRVSVYLPASV